MQIHRPQEAWHVVQQKQKKPPVNEDFSLEKEADLMGDKALQTRGETQDSQAELKTGGLSAPVAQLRRIAVTYNNFTVIGHDTEQLTRQQIEGMINNPGIDEHSREQLQQALAEGDYLGGNPGVPMPDEEMKEEVGEPEEESSAPISNIHGGPGFQGVQTGFTSLLPQPGGVNKEEILQRALAEAQRKLQKTQQRNPGFEQIDQFIAFVAASNKFHLTGVKKNNTIALAKMQYVEIYEAFFEDSTNDEKRADTLIHEISHIIYKSVDVSYKWNRAFKYLTEEEQQHNPDSVVTRMNTINEEPSAERPPETTGTEEVPEKAKQQADLAFAILGDILYHIKMPDDDGLQQMISKKLASSGIAAENHAIYLSHIQLAFKTLDIWKNVFRNKHIHLAMGEAFGMNFDGSRLNVTLINAEESMLDKVIAGGKEKALIWLVSQMLQKQLRPSKIVISIIVDLFDQQHGGRDFHEQGRFPSIIRLNPGNI